MTGRLPVCEDAAAIGTRMRELQAERMASIAGCQCPPDGDGGQTHRPGCALEPRPAAMATPSQISLVLAAVERMRLRAYRTRGMPRTADEIMAEAIAAKNARHRVYPEAEGKQ